MARAASPSAKTAGSSSKKPARAATDRAGDKPTPTDARSRRSRGRPTGNEAGVGSEALIATTLEMLKEVSPGEVTRASVARRANVAPALIRYYFKNRDSLLRTATMALNRRQQENAGASSEAEGLTPAERLQARARSLLEFKLDNPFYHRLLTEELAVSSAGESREQFRKIARKAIERYGSYVDQGVADGSLRQVDHAFLYMAVIGLTEFFVHASPLLSDELGGRPPEQLRQEFGAFIGDLLINGLRAR